MKYLRTPDAVKGRLLGLDCLAKMGSLIANLLPHNATENCKLISTASHALLQAKSPFLQALSMTIMLSGTDHFLLPASDRTLTKARMVEPMSILSFCFFVFFLRAEWLILKDEAQAKYNHSDEHIRPGQRCQEWRSVQRNILCLGSLYEVICKEAKHFPCSWFVVAFHFAFLPYSFSFSKGELELGQKILPPPSNHLPPQGARGWSLKCVLGVFISCFLKNLTNIEMTVWGWEILWVRGPLNTVPDSATSSLGLPWWLRW